MWTSDKTRHNQEESEIKLVMIKSVCVFFFLIWLFISWSYFIFYLLGSPGILSDRLSVHAGMSGIYFLSLITAGLLEGLGILGQLPYILHYLWTTWKFSFCFWKCPLDLPGMQRFLFYSSSGAHIRSTNTIGLFMPLISGTRNVGFCYFWLLPTSSVNWNTLAIYIRMYVLNVKWRLAN